MPSLLLIPLLACATVFLGSLLARQAHQGHLHQNVLGLLGFGLFVFLVSITYSALFFGGASALQSTLTVFVVALFALLVAFFVTHRPHAQSS